jgi:hypothetical protein
MIARRRMAAQLLVAPAEAAEQVVARLGAVQAQDYLGALWAIGARTTAAREADVETAIAERRFVRTWPLRGTLHFVPANDAKWMTALLAPRMMSRAAARWRELGLDAKLFAKARGVVEMHLSGGKQLTRADIYVLFERAKIPTEGARGMHLLWHLAHDLVICFGPRAGKQPTFVLLDEWLPAAHSLQRDEALATLAQRYFIGHGPATLADFAWWSGLNQTEAKRAIEAAAIEHETIADTNYFAMTSSAPRAKLPAALLLPAFDELLVAYTERTAMLAEADTKRVNAGGGILKPVIVIGDRVIGTWQRRLERNSVRFERAPFRTLDRQAERALEGAEARYARFLRK